jgi:hypothetical protein
MGEMNHGVEAVFLGVNWSLFWKGETPIKMSKYDLPNVKFTYSEGSF